MFFVGLTGYYCASVWIGHDNYKALSSKTTGGNSAAKLWKAFMQPIHQGLSNRDIMEGSASDYGLVRATVCKVSGQLATEACRNDVMGYGTTTDYWPAESAPTVSCQMHYTLDVCDTTGMLAASYCPSCSSKGVVILPMGHPLYDYTNSQYSGVLADYLGEYATLRLTADGNANAALLSSLTCPIHQSPVSYPQPSYDQAIVDNQLLPDAKRLLTQAQNQLAVLSPAHPGYNALLAAINSLSAIIYDNPTSASLAAAMGSLTQAMAAAQ